jgi:EpsI family protein
MILAAHSWVRFSVVAILLAASAVLLGTRSHENVPKHMSLNVFPARISSWRGMDVSMSPAVLEALGPGEFLFRDYFDPSQADTKNLFIAFFPSQRTGDTIHSPKNCLPGAGWRPVESVYLSIRAPTGRLIEVNRYVVEKGLDRALVLYWYQSHGRVTPSEYWAKFYLVSDAIRLNRSDGALVRVVTALRKGESTDVAEKKAVEFTQRLLPLLDEYIPR